MHGSRGRPLAVSGQDAAAAHFGHSAAFFEMTSPHIALITITLSPSRTPCYRLQVWPLRCVLSRCAVPRATRVEAALQFVTPVPSAAGLRLRNMSGLPVHCRHAARASAAHVAARIGTFHTWQIAETLHRRSCTIVRRQTLMRFRISQSINSAACHRVKNKAVLLVWPGPSRDAHYLTRKSCPEETTSAFPST